MHWYFLVILSATAYLAGTWGQYTIYLVNCEQVVPTASYETYRVDFGRQIVVRRSRGRLSNAIDTFDDCEVWNERDWRCRVSPGINIAMRDGTKLVNGSRQRDISWWSYWLVKAGDVFSASCDSNGKTWDDLLMRRVVWLSLFLLFSAVWSGHSLRWWRIAYGANSAKTVFPGPATLTAGKSPGKSAPDSGST